MRQVPVGSSAEPGVPVSVLLPPAKLGVLASVGHSGERRGRPVPIWCGFPREPALGWPGGSRTLQDVHEAASACRPPDASSCPTDSSCPPVVGEVVMPGGGAGITFGRRGGGHAGRGGGPREEGWGWGHARQRGGRAREPPWPTRILEAISLPGPAVQSWASLWRGHRGRAAWSHRALFQPESCAPLLPDVCVVFFLFPEMAQGSLGGVFVASAVSTSNGTRLSAR